MPRASLDIDASIAKFSQKISGLDDATSIEAIKAGNVLQREMERAYKATATSSKKSAAEAVSPWTVAAGQLGAELFRDAGSALLSLGKDAFATADNIGKLAADTGLSVQTLDVLRARAVATEEDFTSLTESVRSFGKRLNDFDADGGRAKRTFQSLGVEVRDLNGNMRDTDDLFRETLDAISKVPDEAQRLAMAYEIAGSQGGKLLRVMGSGDLDAYTRAMRQVGLSTSETAAGTAALSDALNKVSLVAAAAGNTLNTRFASGIAFVIDRSITGILGLKNAWETFLDWGEKKIGDRGWMEVVLERTQADVEAYNRLIASSAAGGGDLLGGATGSSGAAKKASADIDALVNHLQQFYDVVRSPPTDEIEEINRRYDELKVKIEAVAEADALRLQALGNTEVAEARLAEGARLRHEADLRRFDELQAAYDKIAKAAEEAAARRIAAEQAASKKAVDAAVFSAGAILGTAGDLNDALTDGSKRAAARQARTRKALGLVEMAINGAVATGRAFADLGPIAGAISAIAVAGTIAAQALTISQQPTNFAHTGMYRPMGDERDYRLLTGEVVVPRPTVQAAGGPEAVRKAVEQPGSNAAPVFVQNQLVIDGAVLDLLTDAVVTRAAGRLTNRPLGVAEVQ